MDTKEGQLRIRDWIDQAFDNAVLAVGKPVVLAAKRHNLVLDPQTGNPGHPIGLQPRARDQASSGPGPPTGADRDTCFGLLDPIDLDPVLDLASSVDNHSADCLAYEPVVHDPGREHKQCTHACDVRLARFQLGGVEFLYFNVVLNRTPVELLHTPRFDLVCGDQHLAADLKRNAVLAAELLCRLRAASAKLCLEAAGRVIDAGMNDPAIMAGLVSAEAIFLFENCKASPRMHLEQFHGGCKPNDAAANDAEGVIYSTALLTGQCGAPRSPPPLRSRGSTPP